MVTKPCIATPSLVLEYVDPETGAVCGSDNISVIDAVGLAEFLEPGSERLPAAPMWQWDFGDEDLLELTNLPCLQITRQRGEVSSMGRLRPRIWTDDLPYEVHTNRELPLMLRGIKPLAVFRLEEINGHDDELSYPEHYFEKYVDSGLFVMKEVRKSGSARLLLYARVEEGWRIPAYLLMQDVSAKVGWSEGFERMEGLLLGYSENECNLYINALAQRRNGR